MTIGISGDPVAADALRAGCDTWYSVLGGTLPDPCRTIVDATRKGDSEKATALSEGLLPLWDLFATYGSYRVVSAIAETLGLVDHPNLPRPVLGLGQTARAQVDTALSQLADLGHGANH